MLAHPIPPLLSSLLISLATLYACSAPPPPPPPTPSEGLLKARELFKAGDWPALSSAVKALPSSGPFVDEAYFYLAVVKGIKHPRYGLDSLRAQELKGSEELRARNRLYQLIFQGLRGECLLALGPLKTLYAPELDSHPEGTRRLIQDVLRACDEVRATQMRQLSADLKGARGSQATSSTTERKGGGTDDPAPTQEGPTTGEGLGGASNLKGSEKGTSASSAPPLSATQLEQVTPHVALFLPRTKEHRGSIAGQLLEVAPIARSQIERTGKPIKIELFEPLGPEELTEQVLNLDTSVQLLVAFTLSSSLHDVLIEASRAQSRPMILLSPHPLTQRAGDQIWRLFTTTKTIAESIIADAVAAQAKRLLLVTSSGHAGAQLAREIEAVARGSLLEWEGHEITPKLKDSEGWSALAKRLSARPFDTLLMALSASQSAQLSTYLATEGVWSAGGSEFEGPLPLLSQASGEERRALRIYLWPSAYEQRALNQAGRYLEGARLMSPVYLEGERFQELNQTIRKEINRDAHIIDPMLIELIISLDPLMREALIKDLALTELLQGLTLPEGILPELSFTRQELMGPLKVIEVKEQRFTISLPQPTPERSGEAPPEGALPVSPEPSTP